MKIRMNPIVKKDLRVGARSMRFSWGLFAYEAVLVLAFLLAVLIIQEEVSSYYNEQNIYSYFVVLFPVLAVTQVCIVALTVPIITASSVSGEKERQTFDIMLTTCMSPLAIVTGKIVSVILRILLFVAASLPIMGLAFVVGGLRWSALFYFLLAVILLSVFSGSVGVFCSAFCRRSVTAVIMSFGIYFVTCVLTFLPMLVTMVFGWGSVGEFPLLLLINPVVFFEEFFMQVMTGESILGGGFYGSGRNGVGFLSYHLAQGRVWMLTSAACILLMSVGFILLAAWRVNPLHQSSGRRRGKKSSR